MRRKKRYKHAVINKRKYYFYTIRWLDITGDAGHKSKEEMAVTNEKSPDVSQSQDPTMNSQGLTLTEEDALKAQIFGCWSIPLGLPYSENLLVRIKLRLKPDGSVWII